MKTGKSLVELATELQRQKEAKKDFLIDTEALTLNAIPDGYQLAMRNEEQHYIQQMTVNDIAHAQIGTHVGIPKKYYDRMRVEYPELLEQNVNGWFRKKPAPRMVRTLDGTVRAFLSERYRRIDNSEIAEAVLPIIMQMTDARVESCEVTDERMYLKVVNPRLETEVVPGDLVQAGIMISNSEVGLGSVKVQPLVYRLVCSNGMIVNDAATRKYHVGRGNQSGENYELYSDETLIADDRAFMLKLQDTVRAAVDIARFNKVVDMMRDAKDARITTTNIPKMVELAAVDFGFTKKEGDGILDQLIRGGEFNLYGMANAITRHSQDVSSYDRATVLEGVGYDVLTMSRGQWRRLNDTDRDVA